MTRHIHFPNTVAIRDRITFLEWCLRSDPDDYLAESELSDLKRHLEGEVIKGHHLRVVKGGKA